MKDNRVRVGKTYRYNPAGMDIWDARTNLQPGDVVEVVNLPGAPKAGTMGHCHVYKDGRFAGLVHVNSLERI